MRRSADKVRVNAQLVDAETGAHLWAERFDREFGDLFALENEITARIANTLGWELIGLEVARPPAQPDALDYILRGRAELANGRRSENIANAMSNFECALALDPRSAEAAGRLAHALVLRAQYMNPVAAAPDFQRADGLIAQALALSPREPSAHMAKGALLSRMRRWEEAMPEFEAVLAVDRNYPGAVHTLGVCKYLTGGSDRESIALAEQAIRLSPHDPGNSGRYCWIGTVHLMQSRIDEAIPWLEKSRSARPEDPSADWFLAAAYGLRGDEQLARARLAEAIRVTASDKYSTIARIRANGELNTPALRDRFESVFLAGLRKAGLPEE